MKLKRAAPKEIPQTKCTFLWMNEANQQNTKITTKNAFKTLSFVVFLAPHQLSLSKSKYIYPLYGRKLFSKNL